MNMLNCSIMLKRIVFLLSIVFLLLLIPTTVLAQRDRVITIPQEEIVDQNPYIAYGEVVEIRGTINGDAYIAAGEVIVDGVINGDLLVAGGNVRIGGVVTQSVRVIGGQIRITADVGGGVSAVGGNVEFGDTGVIEGSLVAAAGNVSVELPVGEGVRIAAGNVSLLNSVGGDVETAAGPVRLGPNADIAGNLIYLSDSEAQIHENATVSGEIERRMIEDREELRDRMLAGVGRVTIIARVISTLSALAVGLILIYLSPKFMLRTTNTLSSRPWLSLGIGFLAIILTPIAIVALLATIIGIPLALILLAIYMILLYLGKLFVIFWLGTKLLRERSAYLMFVAGLAVYFIISLIPVIGGIVGILAMLFGIGSFLITKKSVFAEAKKKAII
jgi:hypothetical protein